MLADKNAGPGQFDQTTARPVVRPGDEGHVLACARCGRPITTTSARIEVQGQHAHTFTNPDGETFRIGCFAEASGLRKVSPQTREDTWFAGYTWQAEVCGTCHVHLGWLYRSGDHAFHGLVLDSLVEAPG